MKKTEMSSPCHCQKESNMLGGGQVVRLVVIVFLQCCAGCGPDHFHSPSILPLLKPFITEFDSFLNLAQRIFAEKEEKWWRVFLECPCLDSDSLVWLSLLEGRTLLFWESVWANASLYLIYTHIHTNAHMYIVVIIFNHYSQFSHCCDKLEAELYVAMDIMVCLKESVKISK